MLEKKRPEPTRLRAPLDRGSLLAAGPTHPREPETAGPPNRLGWAEVPSTTAVPLNRLGWAAGVTTRARPPGLGRVSLNRLWIT